MVITLAFLYLMGLVALAAFLVIRRHLKIRQGNVTLKTKRWLDSLRFSLGFMIIFVALVVPMIELPFAFMIPVQDWVSKIKFLNDTMPFSTLIFALLMLASAEVSLFVVGYHGKRRENYDAVPIVGDQWLRIFLILYVIGGVVGLLTGILV